MRFRRDVLPMTIGMAAGALLVGLVLPFMIAGRDADRSRAGSASRSPSAAQPISTPGQAGAGEEEANVVSSAPAARGGRTEPASVDAPTSTHGVAARGVNANEIKVGILILDLGSVGAIGLGVPGLTPREQQEDWQVFVDKLNQEGGVRGRRLVPVYRRFDSLNSDDMRAACLYLAEDAEVFAAFALAGFQGEAPLCLTQQHGMPFITTWGEPESFYQHGLEFTWAMSRERMLRNKVGALHRQGLLEGRTIGVVDSDHPAIKPAVDNALLPELARRGYRVAHRSTLSQDFQSAAAQIPVEVSQMRAKRVDYVLLALQLVLVNQWVNESDAQGFRPPYALSDFQTGVSDFTLQALPRTFNGIGITSTRIGEWRRGSPLPPVDQACLDHYVKTTGRRPAPDNNRFGTLQAACGMLQQFRSAAEAAGPALTASRFTEAMQGLGTLDIPLYASGSWRPQKYDAADFLRTVRADMACRCWIPVDEFVPAGR